MQMHPLRSNLHLYGVLVGCEDCRVKRAVSIWFRARDVVVALASNDLKLTKNPLEQAVALLFVLHDHSDSDGI
jgi:hypothetical protein